MRNLVALAAAVVVTAAAGADMRMTDGRFVLSPVPEEPNGSWGEVFAVYVDTAAEVPPINGSYRVQGGELVFEPRYPLSPGLRYRAEANGVSQVFEIPAVEVEPTTTVAAVYPSSDVLPENLLKFYIHFSAPMSRGEAYRRIRLLDASGQPVEQAFLELEQELWNADGTRLTVLLDPGRIKSGLVPNRELGLALKEGERYRLTIDAGWRDAKGLPLEAEFSKSFQVGPPDGTPPDVATWELTAPEAGTRDPLTIVSPEPLDRALLERVVRVTTVTDDPIAGKVSIDEHETRWQFTPAAPWQPVPYQLQAEMILEDRAGNSIGRPFEVDMIEKTEDQLAGRTARLRFTPGT